ncbi:MAG TPA: hypothetical protein VFU94_04090 [Conexibacter sp.]|nr:hypothetical protein [Conexibacter sp.]
MNHDGSANTVSYLGGPITFTSQAQRAQWLSDGKPALQENRVRHYVRSVAKGRFSFTSSGIPFTYADVPSIPIGQATMRRVESHLARYRPSETLKQLGLILATAPLSSSGRLEAFTALASTPDLKLCGQTIDLRHRLGLSVCTYDGEQTETHVLIDPSNGKVLEVQDELHDVSSSYPGLLGGEVVEAWSFG